MHDVLVDTAKTNMTASKSTYDEKLDLFNSAEA